MARTKTATRLGSVVIGMILAASTGLLHASPQQDSPRVATSRDASPLPPIIDGDGRIERYELTRLELPDEILTDFDVIVPFQGENIHLEFTHFSMRGEAFQLLVDHGDGMLIDTPAEIERTYRGAMIDLPGSIAAASLLPDGLHAIVHRGDLAEIVIQPATSLGLDRPKGTHVVYLSSDASAKGSCGNDFMDDPAFHGPIDHGEGDAGGGLAGATLELVEIGVECDYEFFQRNSSSVAATLNDVELIMNNSDVIYNRDVGIAQELSTVVIRSSSDDPYSATSIDGRLDQFVVVWDSSPESNIRRDVAHMFSGVNFSGGVIGLAYVGVICFSPAQYGVVESRYTSSLTFRTSLTAHELGHNWNAGHCNSSNPCHIMCSSNGGCNGVSGSNLKFGPASQSVITSFRNSRGCLTTINVDPLPLPFMDDFESAPSGPEWIFIKGTTASTSGIGEPSGIRSLNLDAVSFQDYADDEIRTARLLLGVDDATVSYHYQHRGVESGESLFVEYQTSGGDWVTLQEHVSDGSNMESFQFVQISLPSAALYDGSRLRIRVDVDQANDDWFVDDFMVTDEQVPTLENDDCSGAIPLPATGIFSTIDATDSNIDDAVACSSSAGPAVLADIWYEYTATCTGFLTLSTCGAVDFDCRISIYNASAGCPTSGTSPVACADDTCGTAAEVSTLAIEGQTYLIRIGSSDGSTGVGILTVDCGGFPSPPNDECADSIQVMEGTTSFSTVGATSSGIDSAISCSSAGGPDFVSDIWYYFVAPCTGATEISLCGANFDSRMDVYLFSGVCPTSGTTPLGCGDDDCGDDPSINSLFAIENQILLIRIGSRDGSQGAGDLVINCIPFEPPCPADLNDDGIVNGGDLGVLLGAWGGPGGDLNGDGITDGADLGAMLGEWGDC